MWRDVEVFMYDWNDLVDTLAKDGHYNRYVVERVLKMYGEKVCDKYILVTDENMGDSDPMWSLYHAFDDLFGVPDFFDLLDDVGYERISGYGGSYDDEEKELTELAEHIKEQHNE